MYACAYGWYGFGITAKACATGSATSFITLPTFLIAFLIELINFQILMKLLNRLIFYINLININNMLDFIKHIINNILAKCYAKYYDYEIINIKRTNSSGSFIEYDSE